MKAKAYIALLITTVIWGLSAIVSKEAYTEIHPFILLFLRFGLASFLIAPLVLVKHEHPQIRKKDLPNLVWLSFLLTGLGSGGWVIGLAFTSATRAAIIGALGPILTVPLEYFVHKKREKAPVYIGVLIGFIGTFLILSKDLFIQNTETPPLQIVGDLLIFASAFGGALYTVLVSKGQKRYHTYQKTTLSFMVACILSLPLALFIHLKDPTWVASAGTKAWGGVIYYAIGASAIAFLLYQWAVERLEPMESAIVYYIQPIVTIVAAMIILKEHPTIFEWFGGALVIMGVLVVSSQASGKDPKENGKQKRHKI